MKLVVHWHQTVLSAKLTSTLKLVTRRKVCQKRKTSSEFYKLPTPTLVPSLPYPLVFISPARCFLLPHLYLFHLPCTHTCIFSTKCTPLKRTLSTFKCITFTFTCVSSSHTCTPVTHKCHILFSTRTTGYLAPEQQNNLPRVFPEGFMVFHSSTRTCVCVSEFYVYICTWKYLL